MRPRDIVMFTRMVKQRAADNPKHGFSLLEMLAAAALVTGTMVPALAVIRDAMSTSRDLHRRQLLANYAVKILEDHAAYVSTNWTNAIVDDDFSADGQDNIRYKLVQSDDPSDGGLAGQLMNLEVTVYDDADANDSITVGELQEIYRTKVAKLNSYENEEQ
jgi:type II secretory pathway pseudopilin PulG